MTIRVLIADDQELVRAGFRKLLDAEDTITVVGEAADGDQAVTRATELAPDVVLMDIRMPRLDGIEATRRLTRSTGVQVPHPGRPRPVQPRDRRAAVPRRGHHQDLRRQHLDEAGLPRPDTGRRRLRSRTRPAPPPPLTAPAAGRPAGNWPAVPALPGPPGTVRKPPAAGT